MTGTYALSLQNVVDSQTSNDLTHSSLF